MKIEDVKVGQKLKIAREPRQNHYGHGKVGLTFVEVTNTLIYSPDLSEDYPTFACISPEFAEPADFTKADLKTGMRVQYRNGDMRVVVDGDLWSSEVGKGYKYAHALGFYDEALIDPGDDQSIVKVWAAPDKCEDFFNLEVKGVLLFERFEPPAKTQQEIEYEQLMAKIEELKQQAEKLKPGA